MTRPSNAPLMPSPHHNKLRKIKKAAEKTRVLASSAPLSKKKKQTKEHDTATTKVKKDKVQKKKRKSIASKSTMVKKKAPHVLTSVQDGDIEVVTSAAVKRVATRNGIACIANEAVADLKRYMTKLTKDCLLHARSSARYISQTRTIHAVNLASAIETKRLGKLVVGY